MERVDEEEDEHPRRAGRRLLRDGLSMLADGVAAALMGRRVTRRMDGCQYSTWRPCQRWQCTRRVRRQMDEHPRQFGRRLMSKGVTRVLQGVVLSVLCVC